MPDAAGLMPGLMRLSSSTKAARCRIDSLRVVAVLGVEGTKWVQGKSRVGELYCDLGHGFESTHTALNCTYRSVAGAASAGLLISPSASTVTTRSTLSGYVPASAIPMAAPMG